MDAPRVDGYEIRRLLGAGGCGRVFLARDEDGNWVAVKFFDGMAVQRALLARMTARLGEGGWPVGVMPVMHADFDSRPALRVTPWLGDGDPDSDAPVSERSLQQALGEFPGDRSWPLVREIARALAAMHERRVAHGNLKPGNVFLTESNGVLLSDWTLGNMPGVGRFDFTDAVLYQPPEQLLDPRGYAEENGYRWDVYAFGTLAFRLLTGRFPRCHETFGVVAPAPGEYRREGIHADYGKISANLWEEGAIAWPDEPKNPLEAGFREWINRCLELDPQRRPATMIEVVAGFEAVEKEAAAAQERERLLDQWRRADRRAWRALFAVGMFAAASVVLGALWQLTRSQLKREKADRRTERGELIVRADAAVAAKAVAEAAAAEAKRAKEFENEVATARLEASRQIGDHLFKWALEKGNRQLPPLDGRELRLKRLERYFEDFLTRTAEMKQLEPLRDQARLQLAEVAISSGDVARAETRLVEALKAWEGKAMDAELKMRIATNRLMLALLCQSSGDPSAIPAFEAARKALAEVPQPEAGSDRMRQITAILDFQEAKLLASKGQDDKAMKQLLSATQALVRLVDERPDSAVLRSELAACYLTSATVLEGMGMLGDARDVRTDAMKTLLEMLKKSPDDFALRLELAGCYGAMAETAVLAGDITGADNLSKEAMKLLDKLSAEQPDNSEVASRMAAQLGLSAGLMRDRGQSAEALKAFDQAIRMLEAVRASKPGSTMVSYRLALLWWQKACALGTSGKRDEEIRLLTESRQLLAKLEAGAAGEGPPVEQIQRSAAYLLGDLGHSLQLSGRKDDARKAFTEALDHWKLLLNTRKNSEEYLEGETRCRERIAELK